MANPRIEVEIGAVIDGLKQGFGQAVKIIDTLEKQAQDLEIALRDATDLETIQKLNVDLAKTRSALSQLRTTGIDPLTKATKDYNAVGVNFARLIQDAPFGIIGISNNITALSESFDQARGKGQSFTKILGSIFSGGNLLTLGISVLTSAFVVLQQKGFFNTEKSAESLSDALEEYRNKLEAVKKATIEGQANAQKDIQNFKLLKAQAENANIPFQRRVEAVKELQKTYPNYLGSLTQEQILTGNVGNAYKNLTNELVATAKARAFSNQIAENALSIFTLEQQQVDNVAKLINLREQETRLSALANLQAKKSRGEFTGLDLQLLDIQKQIRDIQLDQVKAVEDANKLKTNNLDLETKINEQVSQGAVFTKSQVDSAKELKRTFEEISNLPSAPSLKIPNLPIKSAQSPGVSGRPTPKTETLTEFLNRISQQFDAFGGDFLNSVEMFTSNLNGIIRGNLEGAFLGIGDAIGKAFATGENVFSALGQSLLDSISNFLGDLGQQLIAFGVAGIAFGSLMEAIKKGGPLSIPAGLGAIAAGTALIAISSAIRNRASAGLSGGGSYIGNSGVSGGTSFTGNGMGFAFDPNREIRGELVARGQDLVYVFNEANNRINKG